MVLPDIWMMHLDSRLISRELKGLTRTATFTEAPAMVLPGPGACYREHWLSCKTGENGVRKAAIPIQLWLCRMEGKACARKPPGDAVWPLPKR